MSADALQAAYRALQEEGQILAGGLRDLSQRASVYHHLFRASGRNHVFPLIAAHGALWAGGYFRFGIRLGRLLSWQFALDPAERRRRREGLERFADAFRDVNRRVCVDTYVNFHFTSRFGRVHGAERFVPGELFAALERVHAARRAGRELSDAEKREVFSAHFLHEQQWVVGPSVQAAADAFAWPLMKSIALRPVIRFAYFNRGDRLWFRNFTDRAERVANGLKAFACAAQGGWAHAEATLADYRVLPEAWSTAPEAYFASLRASLLAGRSAAKALRV